MNTLTKVLVGVVGAGGLAVITHRLMTGSWIWEIPSQATQIATLRQEARNRESELMWARSQQAKEDKQHFKYITTRY